LVFWYYYLNTFIYRIIRGIILCKKKSIPFKKVKMTLKFQKIWPWEKFFAYHICPFESNKISCGISLYHQKYEFYMIKLEETPCVHARARARVCVCVCVRAYTIESTRLTKLSELTNYKFVRNFYDWLEPVAIRMTRSNKRDVFRFYSISTLFIIWM